MLQTNNYPSPIIDKVISQNETRPIKTEQTFLTTVQVPYREGTSERIRAVLAEFNIRTVFKIDNTVGKHLVHPKDPIDSGDQTDCIYEIRCGDCDATYIGETSRQLKVRIAEHKRNARLPPKSSTHLQKLEKDSAIALHALTENHNVLFDQATVVQRGLPIHAQRCCAEAIAIHTRRTCVNRNDSQHLSAIWSGLIANTAQRCAMTTTSTSAPVHNSSPNQITTVDVDLTNLRPI
jgi:hypothetical protein